MAVETVFRLTEALIYTNAVNLSADLTDTESGRIPMVPDSGDE